MATCERDANAAGGVKSAPRWKPATVRVGECPDQDSNLEPSDNGTGRSGPIPRRCCIVAPRSRSRKTRNAPEHASTCEQLANSRPLARRSLTGALAPLSEAPE